jgi:hypothetical protein
VKIKSAKSFRQWYKNLIPARKKHPDDWNEDFMGTLYKEESGFLQMYHGDKEDIYGFLRKEVEMAEDGQAIYEFVQNAADSDSTKFYMFYDENYLIVINNGCVFSKEGVKSILNIGQSFGKQDPDKIGRYGIGFKLVHRLVGKSSGLDELLNVDKKGHRGPILFSWSEKSQFSNFLKSDDFEYVNFEEVNAPWLLKILITNFPSQPTEVVKDLDYKDIEPFQYEELKSFQTFLNSCVNKIDLNSMDSGTVFFLKLGDKKFEYLEKQKQEYLNGLSTSMHFLKSLDTLIINDDIVKKDKEATAVLEFTIENGTNDFNEIGLTELRDKESNAKFKICFANNAKSANEIKKHPNIYKYFPAVKEVNNLSFVIHSNLFELTSNRQNLQDTPVNKNLLKLLSKKVMEKMENCKFENRSLFKNIFTCILMSEEPSSNSSGNGWQSEFFYNILLNYSKKTIPTKSDNYCDNSDNVKINKINSKFNLDLTNLGLSHIQWFDWDKEEDKLLIEEAKVKLGIEVWDIRHIVENAALESINNWISSCNNDTYIEFLNEIEKSNLRKETKVKICQIKLFKFSNGEFFSINDVVKMVRSPHFTLIRRIYNFKYGYSNAFFKTHKTERINKELFKIGIFLSEINISMYKNIFSSIEKMPDEKDLYNFIAEKCKTNKLLANEKKNLFLNFTNESTKFDNVAEVTLKDLNLFCDSNSEIQPLNKLLDYELITSSWLNTYKVKKDEYFTGLKSYLVSDKKAVFEKIYQPNQDIIHSKLTETNEIISLIKLYQDNQRQFFKEFIIKKNEHSLVITKKTSNTYQVWASELEVRRFIEEKCTNNLFILPQEFSTYKEEDGIINKIILHNLILNFVDLVDENKEILVSVIHYDEPKRIFLKKLSEYRFSTTATYSNEDYEYKVLDLACKVLKENEYQIFRDKFIIDTAERSFKYSEIPKNTDNINFATKEFSLSKILPSTYQNSNLISDLIAYFSKQGISRDSLNALFGVNEELKLDDLFKTFSEQTDTLQNAEQFFFLIYYHRHIAEVDLTILGFDISSAVFPSDFALESEKLPEYLQNWIKNNEIEFSELEEIGVFTENSTLVSLRKFFLSKTDFNVNTIAEKLSSNGTMLLNTFELLKEKSIELINANEFSVFKEIVRVINTTRAKGQELIIQDEYNFGALEEKSTEWKTINDFSIYLYRGALPKFVKLNEIQDYVFYQYNDTDFVVIGNKIYLNENSDRNKVLMEVATFLNDNNFTLSVFGGRTNETEKLKQENEELKKKLQGDNNQDEPELKNSFLDDVNEFISELEGPEWNDFIPELKNILELSVSQPKEKQKLFNLIAKIKLAKELDIHFEVANKDYNHLEYGNEKYFVHSARGAFAYIHPNEILKMKDDGYKMALDFSTKSRIKIYETAEEILQLNTNHILAYQYEKSMEELFSFCKANRDTNKHLLIIDKNNSGEKSRALLKLLNIEDDYQ